MIVNQIRLIPWFNCNITCTHCFYQNITIKDKLLINVIDKKLTDYNIQLGPKLKLHLTGGEPLIDAKALCDYLSYFQQRTNISQIVVSTNGTCNIKHAFKYLRPLCKHLFIVVTIDSWTESPIRFISARPLVGNYLLKGICQHDCSQLGLAIPYHSKVPNEERLKIITYAIKAGVKYFEVNLIKRCLYPNVIHVAKDLFEIWEYVRSYNDVELRGDWLSFVVIGDVYCKKFEKNTIVLSPTSTISVCELEVQADNLNVHQYIACKYSHSQIRQIGRIIRSQMGT